MNKLVLLSALMIAIIGTFGTVSADEPLIVDLIADGGNEETAFKVGEFEVTNDEEYLYVTYRIMHEDDWVIAETHLQVAEEVGDIPQTKKGNPKVGKFDNSTDYDPCETEVEYTIPIPTNTDGTTVGTVIIAAHAAVQLSEGFDPDTGYEIFRYESTWVNGYDFLGNNWAMYFTYEIQEQV